MIYFQIFFIVIGVFIIIHSGLGYFFQPKSSFFIRKRIIEYLDESERIKYQKATVIPEAIIGLVIVIIGVFFWNQEYIVKIGFGGAWGILIIWTLVVNKKHLGYFSPLSVPKKN